jgi:hypothetical protein
MNVTSLLNDRFEVTTSIIHTYVALNMYMNQIQ